MTTITTRFQKMKTKKLIFKVPVVINYSRGRDLSLAVKQITEDLQCSDDLTNDGHRVMWKSARVSKGVVK